MAYFIYITENLINGRKYIGKHSGDISDGYLGSGMLLKRAIEKYGIDNFKRDIIEIVDTEIDLDNAERKWIAEFDAASNPLFYNLTEGGTGGNTLKYLPADVVSKTRSGWFAKLNDVDKEKVREQRKMHLTNLRADASLEKQRLAAQQKYYQNLTEDDKDKLYASRRGKNAYQAKSVKTPLGVFDTAKDASRAHNVNIQTILNRCNNPNFADWKFNENPSRP